MRSMIQDGSDDRPPNFVIRGTTKWWIPYDIRSEGAAPIIRKRKSFFYERASKAIYSTSFYGLHNAYGRSCDSGFFG